MGQSFIVNVPLSLFFVGYLTMGQSFTVILPFLLLPVIYLAMGQSISLIISCGLSNNEALTSIIPC